MAEKQDDASGIFAVEEQPGQAIFALVVCVVAAVLLSQLDDQTKWLDGASLLVQPRFWPSLCLAGFSIFALCHLLSSVARQTRSGKYGFFPWTELANWAQPMEYALYFMGYVFLVPQLGLSTDYPSSIACPDFAFGLPQRTHANSSSCCGSVYGAGFQELFAGQNSRRAFL